MDKAKFDPATLIGMDLEAARKLVTDRGLIFRVLGKDGVSHPSTTDLRQDRVNVVVAGGKITDADIG